MLRLSSTEDEAQELLVISDSKRIFSSRKVIK